MTLVLQMENIKDRAALLGYDVWIAPRSSLVLQVSSSSEQFVGSIADAALQLRHYDWNPPELWSRSAQVSSSKHPSLLLTIASLFADSTVLLQEHNWERWRQKLTLIQKSELPAVVSGSTVGFQLSAGTEHHVTSPAVLDHIAQWRKRTQAQAAAAAAPVASAACKISSIDAAEDGRYEQ